MLSYSCDTKSIFSYVSVGFLSFGKSACSFSYADIGIRFCVAANGVMRFSVRSFGCALFYFHRKREQQWDFLV